LGNFKLNFREFLGNNCGNPGYRLWTTFRVQFVPSAHAVHALAVSAVAPSS